MYENVFHRAKIWKEVGTNEDGLLGPRGCKGLMETQDVNETGGLAFLAASKTSKDFSLVTSRFCSSSVLRSIMTRLSSSVLLNFNTALQNIDHCKHANTLISHSKHCLRDLTKQINYLYYYYDITIVWYISLIQYPSIQ